MELVNDGVPWRIEGVRSDRTRVVYASEKDGNFVFTMQHSAAGEPSAVVLKQLQLFSTYLGENPLR